ncbi:site-specific integrase [Mycolicibacterium llatzerense]|uniref:site-specific integrase n=1 Tax=Mycolicibacterium llatzerense TaxID=280871 RepID=UPI0021B5B0BE|nr:site-specific integrase [Mycolicibacterium llatzerense]
MPAKNERKTFNREAADATRAVTRKRLPTVGIREVRHSGWGRGAGAAQIDPRAYRCARLAGQLADQWEQIAAGQSRSVVAVHRQALDAYLDYVANSEDWSASLDKNPAAVVRTLYAWTRTLIDNYDEVSIMPHRLSNIIQTQIAGATADGIVTDSVLAAVAQGPSLVRKPSTQQLDEFTKDELNNIVRAARAHVRAIRATRRWAQATIEQYDAGTLTDPRLCWIAQMMKRAQVGEPVDRPPDKWSSASLNELFPNNVQKLFRSGTSTAKGRGGGSSVPAWCRRAVLPYATDLTPFRLLLMVGTGVSADELTSLCISDIEWTDDGVRLQMTKARAQRSKGRFFPGAPGNSGWSVPNVLRYLVEYTQPARRLASDDLINQLWIRVYESAKDERAYRPAPASFGARNTTLHQWINTAQSVYELAPISSPHDVRRIRKAKVSQRAIDLGGVVADIAGDDHTTRVFHQHYAHTTSLKVYAAKVMSRFQTTLAEAVTTGFTAFLSARSAVPLAALTQDLDIQQSQAKTLKSGGLDMGVVDCRNPFDSPFTKKGKLCASAPLSCLLCENAVVFTDHLPNIIALVAAMDTARSALGPDEWIATWGAQYNAAQALIASLPDGVRKAAEHESINAGTDLPAWTYGSTR